MKDYIKNCMVEGNFTLHSGGKSNVLFDVMKIVNDSNFLVDYSWFIDGNYLVGIEFGGAILASLGLPFGKGFSIIRKDGTIYGEIPDDYVLIDDVVSTENSIRWAIENIGKEPRKIKCIVDRRENPCLHIESMYRWKDETQMYHM